MTSPRDEKALFQRLTEISVRCHRNCRRLQKMAESPSPPPGVDELLRQMRADVKEGLPLAEEFQQQLDAAAAGPFQSGGVTASNRTLGGILLAQSMLKTIDDVLRRG